MNAITPTPIRIELPEKLQFLFRPAPFKVAFGGRGSAKSWSYAKALVILGTGKPLRILCTREIQKSMKDSVHKLLSDQIRAFGLGEEGSGFYKIYNESIIGANGTEFIFSGLKHNIDSIKSKEGIDIVWVEEAQTVSKESWETLLPTLRKDGCEVWVTFNPKLNTDYTYKYWVLKPPPGAVVAKVNWSDNPWFPKNLVAQMLAMKESDYDSYLNVWEGHCKQTLEGAVYANEIREATKANRFCEVAYNPQLQVETFWDLGIADATAIWFVQRVGMEYWVIDYHEERGRSIEYHLGVLKARGYRYGNLWLPHDARAREKGSGRSIEEQIKSAGWTVRIVPNLKIVDGINALRTLFPRVFWDTRKCAQGLESLRMYSYDVQDNGQWSSQPRHDEYSHAADAARYFAVAMRTPTRRTGRRIMAR